jgi:predicted membrane-bound spermidine synthase
MALSHPGLTGAIGGLAMGAADFVIVLRVIRRVLAREMDEGGDLPGVDFVGRRYRALRNMLAGFSFVALPALGFVLGTALGSEGGAR